MMLSRLGSLVVAFFVMSAPVSLTVCKVLCASMHEQGAHAAAESVHSCHDAQPAGSADAVISQMHTCGHADELPVASIAAADTAAPPPTQTTVTLATALLPGAARVASIEMTSGPPSHHARLPLRI